MNNVELIGRGALIVSRESCSVFTGTHTHLRTIPKNIGSRLSRPVNTRVNGKDGAVMALSIIISVVMMTMTFHRLGDNARHGKVSETLVIVLGHVMIRKELKNLNALYQCRSRWL